MSIFRTGDRVYWNHPSGGQYPGTVMGQKPGKQTEVFFDDGDTQLVPRDQLEEGPEEIQTEAPMTGDNEDPELEVEEFEDEPTGRDPQGLTMGGFYTNAIKWLDDPPMINFALQMKDDTHGLVRFHGQWRKTMFNGHERVAGFAVDIWATIVEARTQAERVFSLDSITYVGEDPRKNLRSLNADICSACNRFLYFRGQKVDIKSILELYEQAHRPQIRLHSLVALDRLCLDLKAFRDTAIHCGGHRVFEIIGDKHVEGNPRLSITVELTKQAMALDGKIPSLYSGGMADAAAKIKGRVRPEDIEHVQVSTESTNALVERLATLGPEDKSEARKIRAALRKMGHRGGTRTQVGE